MSAGPVGAPYDEEYFAEESGPYVAVFPFYGGCCLGLDGEELDIEVEGGVTRDHPSCPTAAVPQLRRYRDLTAFPDLRNHERNTTSHHSSEPSSQNTVSSTVQQGVKYAYTIVYRHLARTLLLSAQRDKITDDFVHQAED